MSDQFSTDKLREILNDPTISATDAVKMIRGLLPADPSLPTLASMTSNKRAACQWMQADVKDHNVRYVIANPRDDEDDTVLIDADGEIDWVSPERVIPRSDLPSMEWPGGTKANHTLPEGWQCADHEVHGRVIITKSTPDVNGYIYFVMPSTDALGYDWFFCRPSELTYVDTDTSTDQ